MDIAMPLGTMGLKAVQRLGGVAAVKANMLIRLYIINCWGIR